MIKLEIKSKLIAYFNVEQHNLIINKLLDLGVKMESEIIKSNNKSNILAAKKIVISSFKNISREHENFNRRKWREK